MPQPEIRKVHLIFKTHLDVGFTDFAARVVKNYFDNYIPGAIRLARSLRESDQAERFIWTTGSWLIYEYLEQAEPPQRVEMEAAICAGDIVWHGLPFTTHTELMDAGLFRFGLSLSQELDLRFGRRTIAAKMTDVPGHTRSSVPLMARAGLRFLHIGINGASTPPEVPSIFRWQSPEGAEMMVMVHKGSYGDLMVVPGLDEAIAFAHTDDNLGPQSPEEIHAVYATFRQRFPQAEIAASTLDDFGRSLERVREQLPLVTAEIGDTWLHGSGSDPLKLAQFRELQRLRERWLVEGKADPASAAFKRFSRFLLLVPEHTWGLDEKTHLHDSQNFSAEKFRAVRRTEPFKKMEASWEEQRDSIRQAVMALQDMGLAGEAHSELERLTPLRPDLSLYRLVEHPSQPLETPRFRLCFDPHGALVDLTERHSRRRWAAPESPLGQLVYQTFSQADYDRFYQQYVYNKAATAAWAVPDFTKPGIDANGAVSQEVLPRLSRLFRRDVTDGQRFLLELALPEECTRLLGGPGEIWLELNVPENDFEVGFELQWFQKPACRLPEALWMRFSPHGVPLKGLRMDKMGEPVTPLEVVRSGARKLHGVGAGVYWQDWGRPCAVESLDAALVAPGERSLLNFPNTQPRLKDGVNFLLFDNVWGTNFRMWYEDNARFRFTFRIS